MDRDLRVPYVMSEDSIDLIRLMLDRDVDSRITIEQVIAHPWCTAVDDDWGLLRKEIRRIFYDRSTWEGRQLMKPFPNEYELRLARMAWRRGKDSIDSRLHDMMIPKKEVLSERASEQLHNEFIGVRGKRIPGYDLWNMGCIFVYMTRLRWMKESRPIIICCNWVGFHDTVLFHFWKLCSLVYNVPS